MKILHTIDALREQRHHWHQTGEQVALVPTMGNLHEGHLALVAAARQRAARVVVTIFVNPLQFGANEDLSRYPRTPQADIAKLSAAGADLLLLPTEAEIYPQGQADVTRVEVPSLGGDLCGSSRPGHFSGVATVVLKLFNIVQPQWALFGEKDYQQLTLIRHMVEDLNLPIQVVGVPTVRAADGLALSSRNGYLTAAERQQAPHLYATLQMAVAQLQQQAEPSAVATAASAALSTAGFRVDYVTVRRSQDLAPATAADGDLVILAAAHLGATRLIDNLRFQRDGVAETSTHGNITGRIATH